jgi:hypothetical protein
MMLLAVSALIRISPYRFLLTEISLNLVGGLILAACAYIIGVAISSLMVSLEKPFNRFFKLSNPTGIIQFEGFEENVKSAFKDIFGDYGEWSKNHFYISRALVREKMPRCAAVIERQSSLRQIRRNSVLPVLFLGIVGALSGVRILLISVDQALWGAVVSLISLIVSYVIGKSLVRNGMHKNRKREVREVCCGLLAYYQSSKRQAEGSHVSTGAT